jgi:hypothetical protein
MASELQLRAESEEDIRRAVQFVAELVRQGVVFRAVEDVITHPSGLRGEPGVVVTFTGGF